MEQGEKTKKVNQRTIKNVEKLAIRSEKESKTSGANTKGINSELDKKLDKLKLIEKLKEQKFEMASNQIINNKNIKRKVAEHEKVEIEKVNKAQHTTREVKFVAITTKTETDLREICDIEDEEHESERKQKVQGRAPIDKGKILSGKRENFVIEGPKHQSRVEKTEAGKGQEEKIFDYHVMKSEKHQNVNKGGSLNEKGEKEKGKYEIPPKHKYTKKEKEEKVRAKENYTEATQKRNTQHWIQKKNEQQNWEESETEQKDEELRDKHEKEYMVRSVNIEKQVKDNLRQNGKKEDVEKRSRDNLKGKEPKRNERGGYANTSKNIEVSKKHVLARKHSKREDIFQKIKRPLHKYEKDEAKF